MAAPEKIAMENVNKPGRVVNVDADKYWAVRNAIVAVLPSTAPGLTILALKEAVRPLIPEALFPGGFKAGWWVMGLQLDLRAKRVLIAEDSKPMRLHLARTDPQVPA